MERKKYKMYTLYASLTTQDIYKYSLKEVIKSTESEGKRGLALMYAENIEDLDALTDQYESADDLLSSFIEEVYGEKAILYNPMIIVDKDPIDRKKSYAITDIAFKGDYTAIQNVNNIRSEVESYLKENPNNVIKFRGMNKIYENLRNNYPNMGQQTLIDNAIRIYFEGDNYKRSREAYFKLKELNPERTRNNGIHR